MSCEVQESAELWKCSSWITNSGREEFRYLTPRELSEKRICELHFNREMFTNIFKSCLTRVAVPLDWKSFTPEPIQIDDDEASDECESGIVSETSSNVNVTPTSEHFSSGVNISESDISGQPSTNEITTTSDITTTNGVNTTSGENEEESEQSDQVHPRLRLAIPNNPDTPVVNTTEGSTLKVYKKKTKEPPKPDPKIKINTKFHNLPPQAMPTDFFYQQCPSVEETNNSFPEPPDGELPLFVQQDSVPADESGNSEISEPVPKKRRLTTKDELGEQMRDAMKHLKNITELLTRTEDEFELFGKSVTVQLKKMSLCTALGVQAKIQQLLSQYRINDIKKIDQDKQDKPNSDEEHTEENQEDKSPSEEENVETPVSPQLSLTCASETSDHETT